MHVILCNFSALFSIQFLRYLKDFFQLVYKIENKEVKLKSNDDGQECVSILEVSLSCVGIGLSNFSKGMI